LRRKYYLGKQTGLLGEGAPPTTESREEFEKTARLIADAGRRVSLDAIGHENLAPPAAAKNKGRKDEGLA
jgi:hypothetical protein